LNTNRIRQGRLDHLMLWGVAVIVLVWLSVPAAGLVISVWQQPYVMLLFIASALACSRLPKAEFGSRLLNLAVQVYVTICCILLAGSFAWVLSIGEQWMRTW
jgi:hypothetical protein